MMFSKLVKPASVASVCDLDKVVAKLEAVAAAQEGHADALTSKIQELATQRAEAIVEVSKARKIVAGINKLLGL